MSPESTSRLSALVADGLAGRADGVAGAERALLHRDLHVAERVAASPARR